LFKQITREDITANGKLRPIGARHFATKANMLQNFVNFMNGPLGQDPAVQAHVSGKKIAQLMEELMGLRKFALYGDNIRISEQLDTQKLMNAGSETLQVEQTIPAGVTADEDEELAGMM
jgi:hypothetical protein